MNQDSTEFLQFCIQYASIALLYYDYVLTFSMEVRFIWSVKFRCTTILYIFCRYSMLANIFYLLNISGKLSNISCNNAYIVSGALSVLGRAAIIIVWTTRTYAVFGKSRIVLVVVGTLGLTCIILDILHVPLLRCETNSSLPIVSVLLAIFMCCFETTSMALTTLRSLQAIKGVRPRAQRNSFVYLILEQGLLYFTAVSLFTISSLILNLRIPGGFLQRLLNALTLPLSGLLTARFLLHLRRWEEKHSPSRNIGVDTTNLQFTTVVDTINTYIDEFGDDPVYQAQQDKPCTCRIESGDPRLEGLGDSISI